MGPLAELAREGAGCWHQAPAPCPHSDPWHLKIQQTRLGSYWFCPFSPGAFPPGGFSPLSTRPGRCEGTTSAVGR